MNVDVRGLSAEIVSAQVDDHDVRSPLRGVPSRVCVVGHSAFVNHWERYRTRGRFLTVITNDTCHVSTTAERIHFAIDVPLPDQH